MSNERERELELELVTMIRARIEASPEGFIRFDEFMDLCLYAPGLGYYAGDRVRTGREGDFYTSAYLGPVMGEMIARWIADQADSLSPDGTVRLAEWGGGTGRLAVHILDELRNSWPRVYSRVRYASIERNPAHLLCQREELAAHRDKAAWLTEEEWFRSLKPGEGWIVWSNELVDAFPVKRLEFRKGVWLEHCVAWSEAKNGLELVLHPCADEEALDHLSARRAAWAEGQIVELNLRGIAWLQNVLKLLPEGSVVMTIDYGDTDEELYAPHRMRGTLMCYHRHHAHDDPLVHPGEQDMTAHVNFSDLIAVGESLGLKKWKYMTQREFLLEQGVLDKLVPHAANDPFHPAARKNRQIRQLLLGDTMGELFKVLIQWKK
jgi:SAM-dependent MidA family methyltransferase